jgi:hypothetical protein
MAGKFVTFVQELLVLAATVLLPIESKYHFIVQCDLMRPFSSFSNMFSCFLKYI